MNKSQIILSAIGGTVVLGVLVLGYFIWDASSSKAEKAEALEGSIGTAAGIVKKLPVKPDKKELSVYKDNCDAYANWRAEAGKIASRGDLVFEKTTPAVFKTAIVDEARRMSDLPGCFDGKLVKPEFHFGFKDYVTGGALPPDNAVELARLQREWNDVSSVLKTIAECGGVTAGVVDVRMGKAKSKTAVEEEAPADRKRKAKKGGKAKDEDEGAAGAGPSITSFSVDFMTRPAGLVKAINAFATGSRFVVVENCTFVREKDELAEALGGDAKKAEQPAASSGRRRRRAQQQQVQEEKKDEAKSGMVTDPATAPLLKVTMAFSVYDFRTLESEQTGSADKAKQAEDEK